MRPNAWRMVWPNAWRMVRWVCPVLVAALLGLPLAGCEGQTDSAHTGKQANESVQADGGVQVGSGTEVAVAVAKRMGAHLHSLRAEVQTLAHSAGAALARREAYPSRLLTGRYTTYPNGSMGKPKDDGGTAVWVSAATPVSEDRRRTVAALESLQPSILALHDEHPLVAQSYVLTTDDVAFFSPFIDSGPVFVENIRFSKVIRPIWEVSPAHNPERSCGWLEPYVDATGKGFVVSLSCPVDAPAHEGATGAPPHMLAVAGVDLTTAAITSRFVDPVAAPCLLLSKESVVLGANAAAETLGVVGLGTHYYVDTFTSDEPAPARFRLTDTDDPGRRQVWQAVLQGSPSARVALGGRTWVAHIATVPATGWHVVVLEDPAEPMQTGVQE